MKKFNYLFMSMLVSFIAFTACGDDDEETPARLKLFCYEVHFEIYSGYIRFKSH